MIPLLSVIHVFVDIAYIYAYNGEVLLPAAVIIQQRTQAFSQRHGDDGGGDPAGELNAAGKDRKHGGDFSQGQYPASKEYSRKKSIDDQEGVSQRNGNREQAGQIPQDDPQECLVLV